MYSNSYGEYGWRKNERMNERIKQKVTEWVSEWMNEWWNEWINPQLFNVFDFIRLFTTTHICLFSSRRLCLFIVAIDGADYDDDGVVMVLLVFTFKCTTNVGQADYTDWQPANRFEHVHMKCIHVQSLSLEFYMFDFQYKETLLYQVFFLLRFTLFQFICYGFLAPAGWWGRSVVCWSLL